jgi:hypothetical protein
VKIPANSFITLVEYTNPKQPRVTWQAIDSDATEVVVYDEADTTAISEIVKQQMEIAKDTPADKRPDALRELAKGRS